MISAPDKRRSSGMRRSELHRHDDRGVRFEPHCRQILAFQVEGHRLLEVPGHVVQRAALSDHRDFKTFRDVSRLLTRFGSRP